VNLQDTNSYFRPEPDYDYFGNYINSTLYNNTKPNCAVDLANNLFLANKADGKAGALMFTNANFTESAFNNFTNNTSPNGGIYSSPPASI
jgi:isocitrate dehydrogenase kinase/phosphatase